MLPTINGVFKLCLLAIALGCTAVFLIGCQEPRMSSNEQVKAFELAGPITPVVDIDKLLSAKSNYGTYTVGAGDVLELQMPTILTAVSPKLYKDQQQQIQPYLCRVSDSGTITLPILGQMDVVGKTQAQIEDEIVSAYYPKYLVAQPSVVCNVKEYYLKAVTIVGAITQPGVYQLRSNEMSLVNALMKAGSIVESGASVITIKNPLRRSANYTQTEKRANEVKQWAEFEVSEQHAESIETPAGEVNTPQADAGFSALEVDLAFRPESNNTTQGNLVVQRGSEILYTKKVDIKSSTERAEYIKELRNVISTEQAYIVEQALEQLAAQIPSATAADQTKQLSQEKTDFDELSRAELFEAASDLERDSTKSRDSEKKEEYTSQPVASTIGASGQKYTEIAASGSDNKDKPEAVGSNDKETEVKTADSANNTGFIKPVESNYQPAPITVAADVAEAIVLPVKGLNIPFADLPLMEGDLIEVKRLNPAVFTVIGLAKVPGAFPYPPEVEYSLMQALGFAGGVDLIADPRFVTVYRQDAKGDIVSAVFRIDKQFLAKSCNVKIKPGDVINIDVTPRTKRNVLLHQIFRINFGVFVNPLALGN